MKNAFVARGFVSDAVPFSSNLAVELIEPDKPFGAAHGVKSYEINVLPPGQLSIDIRRVIDVFDTFRNGTYTLFCTITRDP